MNARLSIAAEVLDAWGEAIRGDWSDIDGRSCRAQLDEVSAYLRGVRAELTLSDVNVCDEGDGSPHWLGNGWDHACSEGW
ncbi:hypothetical protein LCGC14_2952660 [marine sediment metagenome]|uniref:Uncharacterized protein n=1 Tax=marine sediment metagenome TaxID=412755 RepID=A0A0F8Y1Z9_9ZZZZ